MSLGFLNNYRAFSFLSLLFIGLLLYGTKPVFINKLALQFEDGKYIIGQAFDALPTPHKDIVIVAVDEQSVNQLGRWPWSRTVLASLLEKLQGASVVGLDIIFSESSSAAEDEALANSIAENENIIAGYFFRNESTQKVDSEQLDQLQDCAYLDYELLSQQIGIKEYKHVEVNIPQISNNALGCAFFNTEPDPDGVYRRYPLAYIYQGSIFPPLAIQLMRYHINKDSHIVLDETGVAEFSINNVSIKNEKYAQLNFSEFNPSSILPAVDVITGKIKPSLFENKIVLVGVTEIGIFDLRPTPVEAVAPGVWLHYTALSNLLNNEVLKRSAAFDYSFIIITLGSILVLSFMQGLWKRIFLYTLSLVSFYVIANLLFQVQNIWIREFYFLIPGLLLVSIIEVYAFFKTERRASEMKRAFSSYVSPEVVNSILANPDELHLGGTEREISILFNDIRNFTALSEHVSAQQLVQILNEIRDPLTMIVLNNRGMLDKYIGDAMMALFNTPLDLPNHADMAVKTALEMMSKLAEINQDFEQRDIPPIGIGVGINTGSCVTGNMGSSVRFEYTAIGDAVNLASRLEGLCKTYKCHIVISEFTYAQLKSDYLIRMLDKVVVKGKSIPVKIYEVMEPSDNNAQVKAIYEQALESYFVREFEKAKQLFSKLSETFNDPTSEVFIDRCNQYLSSPPPEPWDGAFTLTSK